MQMRTYLEPWKHTSSRNLLGLLPLLHWQSKATILYIRRKRSTPRQSERKAEKNDKSLWLATWIVFDGVASAGILWIHPKETGWGPDGLYLWSACCGD